MKRRDFLTLAPAAAVGIVAPATAGAQGDVIKVTELDILKGFEKVLTTLTHDYLNSSQFSETNYAKSIELNVAMFTRYPRFFRSEYILSGPMSLVNDQPVMALSRALDTQYTIEFTENAKFELGPVKFKQRLFETVCKELAESWDKEEARGNKICPYVPLLYMNAFNSETYVPMLGFKTRYGILGSIG